MSIYDLRGGLVLRKNFPKIINLDFLNKGLYILSIEGDTEIISQKLLVK